MEILQRTFHPFANPAAWVIVWCLSGPAGLGAEELPLIPRPKSLAREPGEMVLTGQGRIVVTDPKLSPLGRVLSDEIYLTTGLRLRTTGGKPRGGDIVLRLSPGVKAGTKILSVRAGKLVRTDEGAHTLKVTDRAEVAGFDYRAAAEGTATLLQAIRADGKRFVLPRMTVRDWPHADFTGAMVDVARQENTLESLRQCVQVCRLYKVRYLHLHLTDDQAWTFPSTAFPKLGARNGAAHGGPAPRRYDLDALKALVKYADARGVTLVPEIEMPGHTGAARGAMPAVFSCVDPKTGKVGDVGMFNLASPKLYEALDTLIGEVADVFASSPFIHLGGDEISGLAALAARPETKAFMKQKGLKNPGELLNYFTLRVDEMVRKRGKKSVLWEGGAMEASKDIVVVAWDGNSRSAERLAAKGITTITCPWNLGVPWPKWDMYVCNGSFLKRTDPVLGAMIVAWERTGEVHVQMLRDGVPRRQERTWGPDNVIVEKDFDSRFAATDRLLDLLLFGFHVKHDPPVKVEALAHRLCRITTPVSLAVESAVPGATLHYTLDGREPRANSPALPDRRLRVEDSTGVRLRLFAAGGKPLGTNWRTDYELTPLRVTPEGLLPGPDGKPTPWFEESVTARLDSSLKEGTIRYTLDGSGPTASSPAYDKPLKLNRETKLRARWFGTDDRGRGVVLAADYFKLPATRHAALRKPVTILSPAWKGEEAAQAAKRLTDGYLARRNVWHTPEVVKLHDKDLEVVVDLGKVVAIRQAGGHFEHSQESGVFPPTRLEVSVSDDGKTFRRVGGVAYAIPANPASRGYFDKLLLADCGGVKARYVRIHAKNVGIIPKWHPVAGQPSHLMLDEIVVNPEK
jgi:hexosaminidase